MPITTSRLIALLQSSIKSPHNRTRGKYVAALVARGVSRRALARELGCSESTLRHLEKQVPTKNGEASGGSKKRGTVSPARRSRTNPPEPKRKPADLKPVSAVDETKLQAKGLEQTPLTLERGVDLIVRFIFEHCQLENPYAAQVVREAKRQLLQLGSGEKLDRPLIRTPYAIPLVIRKARPVGSPSNDILKQVDFAVLWLKTLCVWLLPRDIRTQALTAAEKCILNGSRRVD